MSEERKPVVNVEINRRNILAIRDHSETTRGQLREAQLKIKELENLILEQKNRLDLFQKQIQTMQMKLYSGGATA